MKLNKFLRIIRKISKNREKFGWWSIYLHHSITGLYFQNIISQSEIFSDIKHIDKFVSYIVNFECINNIKNTIKAGMVYHPGSHTMTQLIEFEQLPDIPDIPTDKIKTFLMLLNDYFYNCEKLTDKQKDRMNFIIFRHLQIIKTQ